MPRRIAASARDLVDIFLADTEQRLTVMRGLADGNGDGDVKALARAAHSIKSSAAAGLRALSVETPVLSA